MTGRSFGKMLSESENYQQKPILGRTSNLLSIGTHVCTMYVAEAIRILSFNFISSFLALVGVVSADIESPYTA